MYDAGHAMDRALELGESARRHSPPNPWVGCVIVGDGAVVGEGATMPPGGPHAEIVALERAGSRARGATAFVTLEPCAHHGRTPPCADALVDAGLARVVIALEDPDPRVAGAGAARLRDHGIAVEIGAGADRARESLAPYLHHRRTGRAWCLVKTAMSLDGRIAAADGSSRWITGPEARADGHRLRAESQAVVVGAGTALADRPALTARDVQPPVDRHPVRVVLDARGRVPAEGPLFDTAVAPTLIITTEAAPSHVIDSWRAAGAKVETVAAGAGGVDLEAALALLGSHGVLQALVEGGAEVHGALLTAGLVDRVVAYVAPTVLGAGGLDAFGGHRIATLADAPRWQLRTVAQLGADIRLEYDCHAGTT
ncbi:MAG TPA: bifunctional diaminohydroxyphosphoribosylaminopyrimidine deaminase/5-amino-6-(5-phosphoribosylamino)uracil reductase RibD [Acidimicrobiia bacterium]|jgi:diaminohydroxyphosphoribosylaminopyrimidine deaminase/5-amino-6-(5-phosphoribosylamino)uracil reductase|nr:bifunctional diaminohydroxyphosphoribosylaminopyrimidine deaminase/5-amino-6-(5-phosphoribosylamino)uracil reductase RibD [Acidimicrobiia bacterium]